MTRGLPRNKTRRNVRRTAKDTKKKVRRVTNKGRGSNKDKRRKKARIARRLRKGVKARRVKKNMYSKFCIFSESFASDRTGNCRGATTCAGVDHYYLTDKSDLCVPGWNVVKLPLLEAKHGIPAGRRTCKRYKFGELPPELLKYEYVLHIDDWHVGMCSKLKKESVEKIINESPDVLVFHEAHQWNTTVRDELRDLCNLTRQRGSRYGVRDKLVAWGQKIGKRDDDIQLVHGNCFLRKNFVEGGSRNKVHEDVPKILDENGLFRDQVVLPGALKESWKEGKVVIGCPEFSRTVVNPLISNKYPFNPFTERLRPGEKWVRQKDKREN